MEENTFDADSLGVPEGGVEDMISLNKLSEEGLLLNLEMRYHKDLIYTYTGNILVSVNPYQRLPIYSKQIVKSYFGHRLGALPPHIFAIADAAYNSLVNDHCNQSVIISGESGAGKTEATKLILQFLAQRTNKHSEVEEKILEANPVLEAFGNAATVRNNNSSRFGKYIEIHFDRSGSSICGARIINYLLEKSRLVYQAEGERNYHIFYCMLSGASPEELQRYHLKAPIDYHYTNQSNCYRLPEKDEKEDWERIKSAMRVLGMNDLHNVFKVVAAILHLGNITFGNKDNHTVITNEEAVQYAAEFLHCTPQNLKNALLIRTNIIAKEAFKVPLNGQQAADTRDALAKALYDRLFNWLIARINESISGSSSQTKATNFIGVLDIFGFENFKVNSFEQFNINYANEKLQQHFNQHIFKLEQAEYNEEGINWSNIQFKDNAECIDLIEKKPLGILSLLDEESRFPKASDESLLMKLHKNHEKHEHYIMPKRRGNNFIVKHYAGDVSYETTGFLEKNRDTLGSDVLEGIQTSSCPFIRSLFPEKVDIGGKKPPTVGNQFREQLKQLVDTLSSTAPHYVRCLKPNAMKAPHSFDRDLVLAQLRYAGMMETIRIRQLGFPVRQSFEAFFNKFRVLAPHAPSGDYRSGCDCILKVAVKEGIVSSSEVQLGKTKIFLRDGQWSLLEDARAAKLYKFAVAMQSIWRRYHYRKIFLQKRRVALLVQQATLMWFTKRAYTQRWEATAILQAVARMKRRQDDFKAKKLATALLQKFARRKIAVNLLSKLRAQKEEAERRRREIARAKEEEKKRLEAEEQERLRREREEWEREERRKREREEENRRKEEQERKEREALRHREEIEESGLGNELDMYGGDALNDYADTTIGVLNEAFALPPPPFDALPPPPDLPPPPIPFEAGGDDAAELRAMPSARSIPPPPMPSIMTSSLPSARGAPAPPLPDRSPRGRAESSLQARRNEELFEQIASPRKGVSSYIDFRTQLPTIMTPEEVHLYPLKEYAAKHWQEQVSGKLKKKATTIAGLLRWSLKPLAGPLLREAEPHTKIAAEISAKILVWMEKEQTSAAKYIIRKGLSEPVLRDEIYCQLLRMTLENDKKLLLRNIWHLIIFCCCSFKPTESLEKYFCAYVFDRTSEGTKAGDEKQLVDFAFANLRHTYHVGNRAMVPSETELVSLRRLEPIVCRFQTLDGTVKALNIDSATTVAEAKAEFCHKINLRDPYGWAIYVTLNGVCRGLGESDRLADTLAKYELIKKSLNLKGQDIALRFLLKKQLFMDPQEVVIDPVERKLLVHQAHSDIVSGRLLCNETDANLFAALKLQYEFGNWDSSRDVKQLLPLLLSKEMVSQHSPEEWEATINAEQERIKNKSKEECENDFLAAARGLQYYGSNVFPVMHKPSVMWPSLTEKFDLIVNINGVYLFNREAKEEIKHFTFLQVSQWSWRPGSLLLGLYDEGISKNLEVQTPVPDDVCLSLLAYAKYLKENSRYAKALQDYHVDDEELLSFDKDDIIIVKEKYGDGWFLGECEGRKGQFPSDKVQLLLGPPKSDLIIKQNTKATLRRGTLPSIPLSAGAGSSAGGSSGSPSSLAPDPRKGTIRGRRTLQRRSLKTPLQTSSYLSASSSGESWLPESLSGMDLSLPSNSMSETIRQSRSASTLRGTSGEIKDKEKEDDAGAISGVATLRGSLGKPRSRGNSNVDEPGTKEILKDRGFGYGSAGGQHTMAAWAALHFRKTVSIGTLRKKTARVDLSSQLSLTLSPIKNSLTEIKSSSLNKIAISMFQSVMKVMDDFPLGKSSKVQIIQEIIQAALDEDALKDELYCQICKQTTKNPRTESCKKGMKLLALCTSIFSPSDTFMPYLEQFLDEKKEDAAPIATLAELAMDNLKETRQHGDREWAPSAPEVKAMEDSSPIVLRAMLSDGTVKAIHTTSHALVGNVVLEFTSKLGLSQQMLEGWGLFTNSTAGCYPICSDVKVCDVMAQAESTHPRYNKESKKTLKKNHFITDEQSEMRPCFTLKKKLWLDEFNEEDLIQDSAAFNLILNQCIDDVLHSRIPITIEEGCRFAALLGNIKLGPKQLNVNNILDYLPSHMRPMLKREEWIAVMGDFIFETTGFVGQAAKEHYMRLFMKLTVYGTCAFPVQTKDAKFTSKAWLVINFENIRIYDVHGTVLYSLSAIIFACE
ncbi:Myosin-VIIa, variant 2 [Balamuthia mandrillaris]